MDSVLRAVATCGVLLVVCLLSGTALKPLERRSTRLELLLDRAGSISGIPGR